MVKVLANKAPLSQGNSAAEEGSVVTDHEDGCLIGQCASVGARAAELALTKLIVTCTLLRYWVGSVSTCALQKSVCGRA